MKAGCAMKYADDMTLVDKFSVIEGNKEPLFAVNVDLSQSVQLESTFVTIA